MLNLIKRLFRKPAPVETIREFPAVARDSGTHQIIARGSNEQMREFQRSFNHCYIEFY